MVVRGRATSRVVQGTGDILYGSRSVGRRVAEGGDDRGRLEVGATRRDFLPKFRSRGPRLDRRGRAGLKLFFGRYKL